MLTASDGKNKMTPLDRIQRLFKSEFDDKGVNLHMQAMTMEENEFKDFRENKI